MRQAMSEMIASPYTFSFVSAAGIPYFREIFWESLHAFQFGSRSLLTAVRAVPHNDMLFATYLALRGRKHLAPHTAKQPHISTDLIASIAGLIPRRPSSLPVGIIEKASQFLEENMDHLIPPHGLEYTVGEHMTTDGLGNSSISCASCARGGAALARGLASIAGVEGEDIAWIYLSHLTHRIIEDQAGEAFRGDADNLPALREDMACELSRQLYSNPRYLQFLAKVMRAKGGFLSPLVRHFVAFYLECMEEKARTWEEQECRGASFWKERLEGEIGRAEAASGGFLPYFDIIVLGYVKKGILVENSEDPDKTRRSFQLDPLIAGKEVVLQEIESFIWRFFVKEWVRLYFPRNIERVRFVDERSE
jgi:hypothetical protein